MDAVPGQAETQPALVIPEAMNPHEAQQVFAALLQKEETPERNDKGQFAPKESKPEATPKEAEETTPEAKTPAPEPEVEVEAQPARKLKLKYRGEEKEVDETEAIELAQKGYDYTQKSQALAKEREELTAKVKTESEAARGAYVRQLEVQRQAVLKLADQEALTGDLSAIAMQDPARAVQLQLKRQQIVETYNSIVNEQQRLEQQRIQENNEAQSKRISESRERVQESIPGWNDALYGKILKASVDNYGFTQAEVNTVTDHRAIKVLHDALQWREYLAAKPHTVDKRVAAVPKVQKPGTGEAPTPKAKDAIKDGMEALQKSGRKEDAYGLVAQLIEQGRL